MTVTWVVCRYGRNSTHQAESVEDAVGLLVATADDCEGIPVAIIDSDRRIEGAELDALLAAEREAADARWDAAEAARRG